MPIDDSPMLRRSDSFSAKRQGAALFSGRRSPIRDLLRNALERMSASGEQADVFYQRALDDLRSRPSEAVRAIISEWERVPGDQHSNRWALIQLLSDIAHPAALDFLRKLIAAPLAGRPPKDPHGYNPLAKEVVIRTTAVEAIAKLAAGQQPAALEALLENVTSPVFSVQVACALAYQEHGPEHARRRLEQRLGDRAPEVLAIRRAHPGELSPLEGHRHLRLRHDPERHVPPAPAPPSRGEPAPTRPRKPSK
jgi:HEAT repeat protein